MRLKEDSSSWHSNGIVHRDNRHDHSERPETHHSKKDTHKWCKGKVGVEHEYYRYIERYYFPRIVTICENCGKQPWTKKSKDSSIPLRINVWYECNCSYEKYKEYHKVEVRREYYQ